MAATADPQAVTQVRAPRAGALDRAAGIELLGDVHGSGYKEGAALVRRPDGQIVQLGPLMYALLAEADGAKDGAQLAQALSDRFGRTFDIPHVERLAQKLAAQGLLAGYEHHAPPRRNPLLALRWKVLVTNPTWTRRLTAPFGFLFRPFVMWPVLACFGVVAWFVLIHKGVASATSQAFNSPGLLLLVFVLAVFSAGFHEFGHAAATRYGGGTPGGMGMGLYMVWPAFYTDVTDAYRLPKRDRLRIDLAGLYFNALVAVVTMGVWLLWRADALLLLVALQILQMVRQLSPVIRADGYHILSDATGVPDLYAHIGPTLKRLIPGHRHEPSALKGRARALVTLWVLIVVPVLLALLVGAVILLPRLLTTAWDSGRAIVDGIGHQGVLGVLASCVRLLALVLPVGGSILVTQKVLRNMTRKGLAWTQGRPVRRALLFAGAAAAFAGTAWALWPSGQYQRVRPTDRGTLGHFGTLLAAPGAYARPAAAPVQQTRLVPGTHLAVAMIPRGGATKEHPALFVIRGANGDPPVAIVSDTSPDPATAPTAASTTAPPTTTTMTSTTTTTTSATTTGATTTTATDQTAAPVAATAFPFKLPSAPGPGGTQAVAVNTQDGAVVYDVAYALVTVANGAPVTNTNGAYAFASCKACTTVAVSFQIVLIVGTSKEIAPINAAGALNVNCPACLTTAIADQIVVTLTSQPSPELLAKLQAALQQLNALPLLGADGSPAAVAAEVEAVQQQVDSALKDSGLVANTTSTTTSTTPTTSTAASTTTATTTTTATAAATTTAPAATTPAATTTTASTTTTPTTTPAATTATTPTTTAAATTTAATTTAPAGETTPTSTAATTTVTTVKTTTAATTTTTAPTTTTEPTTTAVTTTTATTTG